MGCSSQANDFVYMPLAQHGQLPITTRRSINCLLKHIANQVAVGEALPTEVQMVALGEASRTTVRAALAHFVERGLIGG